MPGQPDMEVVEPEDDFDASLLCPDVLIEEKSGVVTVNDDGVENMDGAENMETNNAIYDYNVTGIKAQFYLNGNEEKVRFDTYTIDNPVQNTKLHCTSCNTHLGSTLNFVDNVYVHPVLLVLICKECFEFYTDGTFDDTDEDGSEKYCRWCGQGGKVFCCSKCPMVFCKICLKQNYPQDQFRDILNSDYWECPSCNPSQITQLKVQCYEFIRYVARETQRLQNEPESEYLMSIDHSQCCLNDSPKKRRKRDPDFVPYEEEVKRSKANKEEPNIKIQYSHVKKCSATSASTSDLITQLPSVPVSSYTLESALQQTRKLVNDFNMANQLYRKPEPPTSSSFTLIPLSSKPPPLVRVQPTQAQTILRFPAPTCMIRTTAPLAVPSLNRPPVFRTIPIVNPIVGYSTVRTEDLKTLMLRKREANVSKHTVSIALANSRFATSLLSIYKMAAEVKNLDGLAGVYESLQKCLTTMTQSLLDVEVRMNLEVRGAGGRANSRENVAQSGASGGTTGASRTPVVKVGPEMPHVPK